jgi:BirA family biotin operon repressor/biotin-[acetyl-CoA-carboxylase] ligase
MEYSLHHEHFREISSTNDYAKELLEKHPLVLVTADYQTSGRGRNQHKWEGDYGLNVYASLGINHENGPLALDNIAMYQILACLATKSVLQRLTNFDSFQLKYPNDVYAKTDGVYKKISGILAEHSFLGASCTRTVIGIGINNEQEDFEELSANATSLALLGYKIDNVELTNMLASKLIDFLNVNHIDIFNQWQKELKIVGKTAKLINNGEFVVIHRILPDGRLLALSTETNEEKIIDNGDSIRYNLEPF